MTTEAGAASSAARKSAAILILTGLAGVAAAAAITTEHLDIGLMLAGGAFGLSVVYSRRLSLSGWCVLMLLATVAARAPTTLLGLPSILEFSHYPVALAFAYAAASRPKPVAGRTNSGKWLAVLLVLSLASALANASHPMRAIFFIVIVGEPLLIIWSIERWGTDEMSERRLGVFFVLLMAIQVPIGLWQGLTMGWNDPVQGTLMGHGAGAHVLGGLFALTAIVAAAGVQGHRIPALYALGGGAVALGMIGAAGAMAVLVLTGISLAVIPLTAPHSASTRSPRMRVSAVFVAVLGMIGALYFAQLLLPDITNRATKLISFGAFPETDIIEERLRGDPARLVFGSGSGTSGSRASLLLTAPEFEQGSPLAALQLPPTEIGLELRKKDDIARKRYGGSAETTASTALGIIGDLGMAGLVAVIGLFVAVWRKAGQVGSWLAPAVRASICLISLLMFLDNWLEYPEFSIPLAMMIAFGISEVPSRAGKPALAVAHESRE